MLIFGFPRIGEGDSEEMGRGGFMATAGAATVKSGGSRGGNEEDVAY
jgi:hypothetical protein